MAFLPALSLAGSAISGIIGAVGAVQQGNATAAASNYQAAVARNNAIIAQQNAEYAGAVGGAQAQRQDMRNRAVGGAIEAAQGASGTDLGIGSPAAVRDSAARVGRLDTETIMSNAMAQVRGYQAQGVNQTAQARLDTMQGQQAQRAGTIGAFSSILGGASSFSDKWLRYQTVGVF